MSVSDLKLLKLNLKSIDNLRQKEPILKESIDSLRKDTLEQKKEIQFIKDKLSMAEKLSVAHEEWVSIKQYRIAEKRLHETEAIQNQQTFESNEKKQISDTTDLITELSLIRPGEVMLPFSIFVLISLAVIGGIIGGINASELPRGEWICDNGDIIALLDVQNDEEHCSDGSDENDGSVWSSTDSRSEQAKDGDEYGELSENKWHLFFKTTAIYSCPGLILVFLAGYHRYQTQRNLNSKISSLNSENQTRLGEISRLNKRVASIKADIFDIQTIINKRELEIKEIPKLNRELGKTQDKIESNKQNIDRLFDEIQGNKVTEKELWNEIKHLIPTI